MKYLSNFLMPLGKIGVFIIFNFWSFSIIAQSNCGLNATPIDLTIDKCSENVTASILQEAKDYAINVLEFSSNGSLPNNDFSYTWNTQSNFNGVVIDGIGDLDDTTPPNNCDPLVVNLYLGLICGENTYSGGELTLTIYSPTYNLTLLENVNCGTLPSVLVDCPHYELEPAYYTNDENQNIFDFSQNWTTTQTTTSTGEILWSVDTGVDTENIESVHWSISRPVEWAFGTPANSCSDTIQVFDVVCIECPTVANPIYEETLIFCDGSKFDKQFPHKTVLGLTDDDNTAIISWYSDPTFQTLLSDLFVVNYDYSGSDFCDPQIALTGYAKLTCNSDPNFEAVLAGTIDIVVYPNINTLEIATVELDDCQVPTLVINSDCNAGIYDISTEVLLNQGNSNLVDGDQLYDGDEVEVTWTIDYNNSITFDSYENNMEDCVLSDTYTTSYTCQCPIITTSINETTQICDGDAPNYSLFEDDIVYSSGAFTGFQWYEDEDLTVPITGSGALYHQAGDCEADMDTLYVGLLCGIDGTAPIPAGSLEVTIFPEIDINHTIWLLENDGEEACVVPSLSIDCGEEDAINTPSNYAITYTNSLNNFAPGDTILPGTTGQILFNIDYAGDLENSVCGNSGGVNRLVGYNCPEQACPSIIPLETGKTISLCDGELPNLAQLESEVGLIGGISGVTFQWYSENNYTSANELPANGYTGYTGDKCQIYEKIIYLVAYCEEDEENTPLVAGSVKLQIYPDISIDIGVTNSIWNLTGDGNNCQVPTLTSNCGDSDFYTINSSSTTKFGEGEALEGGQSGTITWEVAFADGVIPCSSSFATHKKNYSCDCFKNGNAGGSTVTYQNNNNLPLFTQINGFINTLSNVTIESNQKILFQAQNSISIKPGFKTEDNSAFKLKLGGCGEEPGDIKYATLQKQLDGTFYQPYKDVLYVRYDEEYFTENNLTYTIFDFQRNKYNGPDDIDRNYGTNWVEINLGAITGLKQGEYYTLEVSNDKDEIGYLRFLY